MPGFFFPVRSRPPTSGCPCSGPAASPSDGPVVIREATSHDLLHSAGLHLAELPVGLFPTLGERFLRRWHASFVGRRNAIALVAADTDGIVVGFLLGTLDHRVHVGDLVRDKPAMMSLAARAAVAMAVRPRVAVRFLRTRLVPWSRAVLHARAGAKPPSRPALPAAGSVAVAVAIAVNPRVRGIGVGAQLLDRFETASAHAGTRCAELSTDIDAAGHAGGFYERLGWRRTRACLDRDGRSMQTYRRHLDEHEGRAPMLGPVTTTEAKR